MPAAPASVVAVPMTMAPRDASSRAIARPMPREAPVTKAILSFSSMAIPLSGSQRIERGLHRVRVGD